MSANDLPDDVDLVGNAHPTGYHRFRRFFYTKFQCYSGNKNQSNWITIN